MKGTMTERIAKIMSENPKKEYRVRDIVSELENRGIEAIPDTVKRLMLRLHSEGVIDRVRRGVYRAKPIEHGSLKLNTVFLRFNTRTLVADLEKAGYIKHNREKIIATGHGSSIDIGFLGSLIGPLSQDTLYWKYNETHTTKKIKDGYQDEITFSRSGHRRIIIKTYSNGSMDLTIACDKEPLSPSELVSAFLISDAIFQSKYGYSLLRELMYFFIMVYMDFSMDFRKIEYSPDDRIITIKTLYELAESGMLEDWLQDITKKVR